MQVLSNIVDLFINNGYDVIIVDNMSTGKEEYINKFDNRCNHGKGKGRRFWPKSRLKMPKQFLKLYGDKTMIQQTVDRLKRLMPIKNIFVVTNIDYAGLISDQMPELPTENILIEPMWRNAAACIGLVAFHTERLDN